MEVAVGLVLMIVTVFGDGICGGGGTVEAEMEYRNTGSYSPRTLTSPICNK